MEKKIRIAFDLDGVIVNKPPIIPKSIIECLFRGSKKKTLHYKIPKSAIEIIIRKLSHLFFLRPPLTKNIEFIKKLKNTEKYEIYIVSGRYSFLKNETKKWLENTKNDRLFEKVFTNENDEQPHVFKEKILGLIKPHIFVDDDDVIIEYLQKKKVVTKLLYLPEGMALSETKILKWLSL